MLTTNRKILLNLWWSFVV